jgi:hypothetical protein
VKGNSQRVLGVTPGIRTFRRVLLVSAMVLTGMLLCYTFFSLLSAKRFIAMYNEKLLPVNESDSVYLSDPGYATYERLIGVKSFLESQVSLLSNDSLNLTIDLKDSIARLVIEGVTLHRAPIKSIRISRFFNVLNNDAYARHFGKPLFIESYESTIVKEPITIKQAPKDTLEAAAFFEMPDTTVSDMVAVRFKLENGIILSLRQDEKPVHNGNLRTRYFFLKERIKKVKSDFSRLFHFRLPEYEPQVDITMSKGDMVTLFRALPDSAFIALRLR